MKSDMSTELKTRQTRRFLIEPVTARCHEIEEDELLEVTTLSLQAYEIFLK